MLSNLALRHAEATLLLARTDMVMLPGAWATARAGVEIAARCLWLLEPSDEWEREARWLALMHEGARLGERTEVHRSSSIVKYSDSLRHFTELVEAKLPPGTVVPGLPTMKSLLAKEGDHLSAFYVLASQHAHGVDLATHQWRTNLGGAAEYHEKVRALDWYWPLWPSWLAFRIAAARLMVLMGEPRTDELSLADSLIEQAKESLLAAAEDAGQ